MATKESNSEKVSLFQKYCDVNLILRILCGLAAGILLAVFAPGIRVFSLPGSLFVGALKGIAPVLVFALVCGSLASAKTKLDKRFGFVLFLYLASTFLAAAVAVLGSFVFPQHLQLAGAAQSEAVPTDVGEVLLRLLANLVVNPISALAEANYIGILFWSVLGGFACRRILDDRAKEMLKAFSDVLSKIVRWIIELAPVGIFGLAYIAVAENGLGVFKTYGCLLALLVGCMLTTALVVNPFLVWLSLHRNPYPLVFRCLQKSGVTAFFTRSSAANIPVNMALCEEFGLDRDIYSVSIPLGATINMNGAAVTITVMALAAAYTAGITVSLPSALILSILATLAACGASGVAGGSLLLIPMACSLFGISPDTAMQVVGVGFIIGVVQDSFETMINSSGDVLFAATAEYRARKKG
ncbi:MAG: serine/threonine transporter SstT [Kiritimatiellae bacterium]|nr:serine/threonine transporter SstT [Kiritimatiellia bacterium]